MQNPRKRLLWAEHWVLSPVPVFVKVQGVGIWRWSLEMLLKLERRVPRNGRIVLQATDS